MEEHVFRYGSIIHLPRDNESIGFILRRDEREFVAWLSVADAERLASDLSMQVHIAKQK
jgi:hypothetical protein